MKNFDAGLLVYSMGIWIYYNGGGKVEVLAIGKDIIRSIDVSFTYLTYSRGFSMI